MDNVFFLLNSLNALLEIGVVDWFVIVDEGLVGKKTPPDFSSLDELSCLANGSSSFGLIDFVIDEIRLLKLFLNNLLPLL